MRINMRKGVSMIVLVITIIVILIISATVILMANKANYSEIANEAVFKNNLSTYKSDLAAYIANETIKNVSLNKKDINANEPSQVRAIIGSMTNKDSYNFIIEKGNLVYIGEDEQEQAWVRDEMIEVATDRIIPAASIFPNTANPTNATKITYEISINKSNIGFSLDDINLNFGTVAKFEGSNRLYNLEVTDLEEGEQTLTIPANSFTDKAGIPNIETVYRMKIDYTSPMLTSLELTNPESGVYVAGQEITIVANYDEAIYNLDKVPIADALASAPVLQLRVADFEEEGVVRQVQATSATDTAITYTYTITDYDQGDIYLESYAGDIYDLAGNSRTIESASLTGSNITANIFHSKTTIQSIDVTNVGTKGSNTHNGYFTATVTLSGGVYSDSGATTLITTETAPKLKVKFGDGTERVVETNASSIGANSASFTTEFIPVNGENGQLAITGFSGTIFGRDRRPVDLNIESTLFENCIADTTAPSLTSLAVTNPTTSGTYYNRYQTITFVATYDDNLYDSAYSELSNNVASSPVLQVKFGNGAARTVSPSSASGNTITYTYSVQTSDLGQLSLVSYSGSVYDVYGNQRNINSSELTGTDVQIDEYYSTTTISDITMTSTGTKNSSSSTSYVASVTFSGSVYSNTQGTLITTSTAPKVIVKFGSGSSRTITADAASVNSSGTNFTQSFLPISSENGYLYITGISGTVYGADKKPIDLTITERSFTSCLADNTGPTLSSLSVTSPTTGTYAKNQVITITATFSDSSLYSNSTGTALTKSTAPTVQVKFGTGSYKTVSCDSVSGSKAVYKYTLVQEDKGRMYGKINGYVYDSLGNSGYINSTTLSGYTITASTPDPLSVSLSVSQSSGRITATATAAGGTSSYSKYTFKVDGSQVQATTSRTYSFTPTGTYYSFNVYGANTGSTSVTANASTMSNPGYGYYFTVTVTDSSGATATTNSNFASASNSTISFAQNTSGGPTVYATQLPYGSNWVLQYSTNGTSFTTASNPKDLSVSNGSTIYARFYNAYSGSTSGNKTYTFNHVHNSDYCYTSTRCYGSITYNGYGGYYCSTCGQYFTSYQGAHYRKTLTCGY